MAFIEYQPWTRADFKGVIRREMMDTNTRWFGDGELNLYLDNWLQELQQEFEFVWAVATLTVGTITSPDGTAPPLCIISTSIFQPSMLRNDAVYYNGFRLAGRLLQDIEVGNPVWRGNPGVGTATDSNFYDIPRASVMYPDSQSILIWPCPPPPQGTASNVFIFEYPSIPSFATDTSTSPLPVWTQWSAKSYVASRLYQRPGPLNDARKAMRYAAQYARAQLRMRRMWDSFLPERSRRLQPGAHYEWEILTPPPAWDVGTNTASSFRWGLLGSTAWAGLTPTEWGTMLP